MSANLRAILFTIRWAEGTGDSNGYRALYGHRADRPRLFDSFDDHPRQAFPTPWGLTSAAGAYQFMSTVPGKVTTNTWDRAKEALGLQDFSPESQDKAAIWLIEQRGALQDIERGDLKAALDKISWEWASLPPGRYGQPMRSYEDCETIFERAGGTLLSSRAPVQPVVGTPPAPQADAPPAPAPVQSKEKPMANPLILAQLGIELAKLLPWSKKNPEKAAQIAGPLLEVAKVVAPQEPNEQARVQAITTNPILKQQFIAEAAMRWSDLEPMLQYESLERERARTFAERMTDGDTWRAIGYGSLIATLALLIIAGGGWIFTKILFSEGVKFSQSTVDGIIEVLKAIVVLVVGFFFGSSVGSKQASRAIEHIAERKP